MAIDFPLDIVAALAESQPPAQFGVRPTARNQLHLTLHFLGEHDTAMIVEALKTLQWTELRLAIEGIGTFKSRNGGRIVWAGIRETAALRQLHQAVAAALIPAGYQPELRPFAPHITLARCSAEVPDHVVDEFITKDADLKLPEIRVRHLTLYSSTLTQHGSIYQNEFTISASASSDA